MAIVQGPMRTYLGTDVARISRIRAALARFGPRFLHRVYTPAERQDCCRSDADRQALAACCARSSNGISNGASPAAIGQAAAAPRSPAIPTDATVARLAGRWAAKEATVKALGTGWRGVGYREVEIRRSRSGAPTVRLHGRALARWQALTGCPDERHDAWQVSFSHDGDYATATAIALAPAADPPVVEAGVDAAADAVAEAAGAAELPRTAAETP